MHTDFIYLASASPRRQELLSQIGVAFEARPASISEEPEPNEAPRRYVERIARTKAAAIWDLISAEAPRPVLGADTAVIVDDDVLGKPGTREAALEMLACLSGRSHVVLTAVAVQFEQNIESAINESKVRFRHTTRREREAYCDSREPFDKAGGYAIQGMGAVFVADISGSYSGVMGLPLFETAQLLSRYAIPGWLLASGREL